MSKTKKKDGETKGAHRCKIRIKHKFSNEELLERSSLAAQKHQDIELKEEAVKAASAVAKSEIKQLKSDLSEILNTLRNGSEEREVDATVEYNPKKGIKRFYHFAPGNKALNKEFIEEKAMQEEDYQLPGMEETFDIPKPKAAAEAPAPEPPKAKDDEPEEDERPAVHSAEEQGELV